MQFQPTKTMFLTSRILAVALLFITVNVMAQSKRKIDWHKMGNNKNATFYDVQKKFNKEFKSKLKEEAREKAKGKIEREENETNGVESYKRWENYMAPRVYPSGNMALPSTNYANYMAWQNQNSAARVKSGTPKSQMIGNWTAVSPSSTKPKGYDAGVGRVDFVRFDPTNSNTMYIGCPDGGLWKSTNGGTTWSTNTDFLAVIGCADLAIDPTNTQTMYLASGNWEGDRRSIGILKSTDGGASWNATSLVFTTLANHKIRRLIMDPTNPLIMLAATDAGIYRTTDGWATNAQTIGSSYNADDIKFNTANNNIVYASAGDFLKSTDNGINWTTITTGLPTASSISRMLIGVTPNNPAFVYTLAGDASGGYLGLYLSKDTGNTFILQSSSPNLLQDDKNGIGTGGQAAHDLAIAVSPTDSNLVTVGGINLWQSTDGGVNWTLSAYWLGNDVNYPGAGDATPDYVHADIQSLEYLPSSSTTMFATCDGGISKSTNGGLNWTDISNNLNIAQQTCVAMSASLPTFLVTGLQDIGTLRDSAGVWSVINGGDGEAALIDRTNNNNVITSNPNGNHALSFDRGLTKNNIAGLPTGQWFSPISQDPILATKIYAGGRNNLYRSTNLLSGGAYTWDSLGTPTGTGNIVRFVVAPSSSNIIYAIKVDAVSKSIDSGLTFTDITATLPVATSSLTNLTISNTNPNNVWVTFSGYTAGDKVFKTINGGTSWTNISTSLPNLPINTIIFQNGSATNAIYIGADIGVYYLNDTLPSFVAFNNQLPHNAVTDLEIYYPTSKLRASTYGRGTWESDLFSSPVVIPNGIETVQNNELKIYPNPTNTSTTISLTKLVTNATIKLINVTGETVLEKTKQTGNQFNLDISRQTQGIYFIEVRQDRNIWRGKIVKE